MNGVYTKYLHRRNTNAGDIVAGTLRALLLRSTGAYAYNPDHNFVSDIFSNGGVELTVASYARQTLATKTITKDDANDRDVLDFDDIPFGSLEAGQSVAAILFYEFITNDAASPLIYHIDGKVKVTAAAPIAAASSSGVITGATQANPVVVTSIGHGLSNGMKVYIANVVGMIEINNQVFTVAGVTSNTFQLSGINGSGFTAYTSGGTWSQVQTVYTDKLRASIGLGAAATFGAVTGVVRANANKGDRSLLISAVSGAINPGDNGIFQSTLNLPAACNGTPFTVRINAAGFLASLASY
jgi:hypothetical protein